MPAKIVSHETLEPGKRYLRPALCWGNFLKVPIWGSAHDDVEFFNVAPQHYHVDTRFEVIGYPLELDYTFKVFPIKGGTIRRAWFVCRDIKPAPQTVKTPKGTILLQNTYIEQGITLKSNLICPHKRFDLSLIAPDENSNVICPLHGLCWNLKTRKVVPRT